jgi:hypothetical protein
MVVQEGGGRVCSCDGGVVGEGDDGRRSGGWRDEQLQVSGGIQQQLAATGVWSWSGLCCGEVFVLLAASHCPLDHDAPSCQALEIRHAAQSSATNLHQSWKEPPSFS